VQKLRRWMILGCIVSLAAVSVAPVQACDPPGLSTGQTIYVPAYSHIYSANDERPFLVTVTLSIRNTDLENPIKITRADYYETQGRLLVSHIDSAVVLGPLESLRYVVPEKDKSGGSGANFIVEWEADECTNPPVVETIMIGTQFQQGVSFTSRGQVIIRAEE